MAIPVVEAQTGPTFKLGFETLADQIPDVAGQPLENEHYGPNSDSLQQTTTGLKVGRKPDYWTAFTNGLSSWINGPAGAQSRLNNERLAWEARLQLTPWSGGKVEFTKSTKLTDGGYLLIGTITNTDSYWNLGISGASYTVRDLGEKTVAEVKGTVARTPIAPGDTSGWTIAAGGWTLASSSNSSYTDAIGPDWRWVAP